jgi:hypothetical protein
MRADQLIYLYIILDHVNSGKLVFSPNMRSRALQLNWSPARFFHDVDQDGCRLLLLHLLLLAVHDIDRDGCRLLLLRDYYDVNIFIVRVQAPEIPALLE